MLVAFKCLLEIQSRAAKIDAIGMFFYTEGKLVKFIGNKFPGSKSANKGLLVETRTK